MTAHVEGDCAKAGLSQLADHPSPRAPCLPAAVRKKDGYGVGIPLSLGCKRNRACALNRKGFS
ncbi:hypothetical protein, partial [Porphyrobacter sp. GA68]|uniref:hypothetical protein n=1 Tax=Porphyrobacter sp. GA68 TaxID=2883480 RepID=UPI001F505E1B